MKKSKKKYLFIEEANYVNKKKKKRRKKKSFCNCYNNVLILLTILLISSFLYIIQIKHQQKIIYREKVENKYKPKATLSENIINKYQANTTFSGNVDNKYQPYTTYNEIVVNKNKTKTTYIENVDNNQPLETFDLNVLESIQNKLIGMSELIPNEQKFFNGVLRKYKPKKVVEIGVSKGGTSALILNAIKDIEGAKLYSIDKATICYRNQKKNSGYFVEEYFPEFKNNWELNIGGITSEFIEKIGGDIDLVMLDTVHLTPGEMLDWLQVLPFLKEEAIVVLHDTFFMYYDEKVIKKKLNCPNNQLLTFIRGELILPSYGNSVFFRNIGALKLDKDQKKYYKQYFLALGTQWEYMPEEKDLKIMREFFMKYYGEKCVEIFDDAVTKNKIHLNLY